MKLLLYCTKQPPYLVNERMEISTSIKPLFELTNKKTNNALNGKIVGECDFEVERILSDGIGYWGDYTPQNELAKQSCLNYDQVHKYLNNNDGYAIHIKNLNIFDKARELSDYYKDNEMHKYIEELWANYGMPDADDYDEVILKRPPQNMCKVIDEYGNKNILISIRPEYLVKILNKEKTIEIRKKVLKEMMPSG